MSVFIRLFVSRSLLASSQLLPFFFFNDTATTEIYTLSLHDALPIYGDRIDAKRRRPGCRGLGARRRRLRSEEHTSELQSRVDLVCRLLLEKKKKRNGSTWHGTAIGCRTISEHTVCPRGYNLQP